MSSAENKATNITWHEGHVARQQREVTARPERRPGLAHRPSQLRKEHNRLHRGTRPGRPRLPRIRPRWGQHPPWSKLQPRVLRGGSRRKHPPHRGGRKTFRRCRHHHLEQFREPLPARSGQCARQPGRGRLYRNLRRHPLSSSARRETPRGCTQRRGRGEISNFTGVSDPYEPPENPELVIPTASCTPEEAAAMLLGLLLDERGKTGSNRGGDGHVPG